MRDGLFSGLLSVRGRIRGRNFSLYMEGTLSAFFCPLLARRTTVPSAFPLAREDGGLQEP